MDWLECYLERYWKDGEYAIEKGRGEGRGRCREWTGCYLERYWKDGIYAIEKGERRGVGV